MAPGTEQWIFRICLLPADGKTKELEHDVSSHSFVRRAGEEGEREDRGVGSSVGGECVVCRFSHENLKVD